MINLNDMVRAINLLPLNNRYNEMKRPLSDVLVVKSIDGDTITAKNGAGDTYQGGEDDFAPVFKSSIFASEL